MQELRRVVAADTWPLKRRCAFFLSSAEMSLSGFSVLTGTIDEGAGVAMDAGGADPSDLGFVGALGLDCAFVAFVAGFGVLSFVFIALFITAVLEDIVPHCSSSSSSSREISMNSTL